MMTAYNRPSVSDFGAQGDGSESSISTNDAAFAAAAAAGNGNGGFTIPGGKFMTSLPIVTNYSRCSIEGDDKSSTDIITTSHDDVFVFDYTNGFINFCGISDVRISYAGNAKPTGGAAVRLRTTEESPRFGMTNVGIKNVFAQYMRNGIIVDKAGLGVWGGIASIAHHGHIKVDNFEIPYNNGWTDYGIKFKAGPGAHNSFTNSNMSAAIAGIEMGDGTGNCGVGDQLFDNLHLIDSQFGIAIYGPSNTNVYNENVTISGCQFDGITNSTVRMRRMENFRIRDCNSTASATYDLSTCKRYSIEETGAYGSEYTIRQKTYPAGTYDIPLFEVSADAVDTYRSVYAEIYVDTLVGSVGPRPVLWRGFLCYTDSGSWTILNKEKLMNGTGANVSFTIENGKARCILSIVGATSQCKVDGTFRLSGRNYWVTKLT